jgi:6-phosphogluconolactonase (cycloisomerase 2 family)
VNPAGTFLYAADLSTNAIDGLSISSTGALSTISGSPFSAPGDGGILGVAVDPSGKFLYATTDTASGGSGTGLVVVFSIDSTTGALSPVAGSPFPAGVSPTELVVAPSGQFLYVSDSASGILAFSVASGTLTPIAGSPFPSGSRGLAVTPGAAYLYAIDVDNVVSAFSIDSATGALTQVSGSPFLDSAGSGNFTGVVIVDPTGSFLYTYNTFGAPNTISGFAVDSSTGALSPVAGSPFSTGETTFSAANLEIEPSGKFIYASCADGNCGILEFSIDATTGALTPATGAPFDLEFYVGGLAAVSLQ